MKNTERAIFQLMLCILLTPSLVGCWELKTTDISSSREAEEVIGDQYEVRGKVTLYGYRDHSGAPAKSAFLWAGVGMEGSYIAFSKPVPKGTRLTVTGLTRVSDIPLLTCRRALVVDVEGMEIPENLPVSIDLVVNNRGQDCSTPNEAFYKRLGKAESPPVSIHPN